MRGRMLASVVVVLLAGWVVASCDGDDGGADADGGAVADADTGGGNGGMDADTGGNGGMDADTGENGGMDADTGGNGGTDADTGGNGGTDADAGENRFEEVTCGNVTAAADVQVGPGTSYDKSNVDISAGEVVRWTWASSVSMNHNVTADVDSDCTDEKPSWFQSQTTSTPGHTFCVRFNETGTWNYHCTVGSHCSVGMKATVTVN